MRPSAAQVLVVDGNAPIRRIVCELLLRLGIGTVDEAADAAEALNQLALTHYQVVIADKSLTAVQEQVERNITRDAAGNASTSFFQLPHGLLGTNTLSEALTHKVLPFIAALPDVAEVYEPRHATRIPLDIQVRVTAPDGAQAFLLSGDWTRQAVFLRTNEPLPSGSRVSMDIVLRRPPKQFHLSGVVIRSTLESAPAPQQPSGMVIAFDTPLVELWQLLAKTGPGARKRQSH